jgi:hypothetical protein
MLELREPSACRVGLAAAVAIGVAACGGGTAPKTLLTTQQAVFLSEAVALDAEGNVADATASGATTTYNDAPPRGNIGLSSPQCTIARSPASPPDADADGVPDSVRFTVSGCVLSYPSETDTLRGTIDILDPTVGVDHAVKRIFTSLVRARLRSGTLTSETWNGTRTTTRDSSTLHHTDTNFRADFVFPNGTAATHLRTWTSTFTADTPASIQADQTLPSGSWTITGTSSWTQGGNAYSITLSTSRALHYNATCTATPRFDAGTLTAAVTLAGQMATVTIQFTACGAVSGTVS